jgi:hypothetical protein
MVWWKAQLEERWKIHTKNKENREFCDHSRMRISGSVSFTAFTYDGDAPEEHMAYFSSPGPTFPLRILSFF